MAPMIVAPAFVPLLLLLASLPGLALGAAQVGGVYVKFAEDYQSARLTEAIITDFRVMCRRLKGQELQIRGDTALVGRATLEQYYSADGTRRSWIRRRHLNVSKDLCLVDVQPVVEKKLFDYTQNVAWRYTSTHRKPWSRQRLLSRADATVAASALADSDIPALPGDGRSVGKDKIAGVSCDIHKLLPNITACVWLAAKSGDIAHPRSLNLSYQIEHEDGRVDTSTAVSVNLKAAIDAELLFPPAEALTAK